MGKFDRFVGEEGHPVVSCGKKESIKSIEAVHGAMLISV